MMFKHFGFCVLSLFIFSSCGGGGGGNGGDTGNTGPSVTLSGVVTYTHYKTTPSGIDYNNPTEKPIRGAIAELRNSSGTVLKSGNTSETGAYSFSAPSSASLSVVIKAALGTPATPHIKVVDNTDNEKMYAMTFNITTGTGDLIQNFNANSGWSGSSYSGTRVAGPFAILDSIYQAEQLILSADASAVFPELTVNWSKNNKPVSGNLSLGEIGTSFYTNNKLYILGAENSDTDEYDASIIAHEWSHYFENNLSRSDSIGGNHGTDDILDPRLAFGEGFGNAFSGMVVGNSLYIDTSGSSQGSVSVQMDLEQDSVLDSRLKSGSTLRLDGFYSEFSIQEVLYDLFDSGASDDDNISLGFKPIYDVMQGGQKTTPAFTSIFSFLKYLKDANTGLNTEITALAAAENIGLGAGNEDEFEDLSRPIYTNIPVNGTIVNQDIDNDPLQTWTSFGPITANNPGNKLYNRMFFWFSIPAGGGSYTIEVTSSISDDVGFTLNEKGNKTRIDVLNGGGVERLSKTLSPGLHSMDVFSFEKATAFTVRIF